MANPQTLDIYGVGSYGSVNSFRCTETAEYQEALKLMQTRALEVCKGNQDDSFVKTGNQVTIKHEAAHFYTCPDFVHSTYELGTSCPENYTLVKSLMINGQDVSECISIISGVTVKSYINELCELSTEL